MAISDIVIGLVLTLVIIALRIRRSTWTVFVEERAPVVVLRPRQGAMRESAQPARRTHESLAAWMALHPRKVSADKKANSRFRELAQQQISADKGTSQVSSAQSFIEPSKSRTVR